MTSLEQSAFAAPAAAVSPRSTRRLTKLRAAIALVIVGVTGAAASFGSYQYRKSSDLVLQAKARLDAGDASTAKFLLIGALRTRPESGEVYFLLGQASIKLGDPITAEHMLRRAGNLGVAQAQLRLPLAAALLGEKKARQALELLDPAKVGAAEQPGVLMARVRALRQLHDEAGVGSALDEAARLAPELIDVPLVTASFALERHDLVRAEREADRALSLNGRSADALLLKAQSVEQRGKRAAAIDILSKVAPSGPGADRVRLERARMLLMVARTAEARTELDAVLKAQPGNPTALFLKANVLIESQDYNGADLLLRQIARAIPLFPRGWYAVADVKLHLEQLELAGEAINKFVARAPTDVDGRKLQARIAIAASTPDQAIDVLSQLTKAVPADAEIFDLLGTAQAMANRAEQAVSSFNRAAEFAPNNPAILAHLGLARLHFGDSPGAVDAFDRSLELSPEQFEVSKQLVVAAVMSGAPDRAARFLAALRGRTGETVATGQLEALLSLAQLDPAAAAKRLAAVAAKNPADASVKVQLARVLLMQGRRAEAEAVLGSVLAMEPTQDVALDLLVQLLVRDGRVARAATVIGAARAATPGNDKLTLMLASLYQRAGDPARALAAYGGAAQHDGSLSLSLFRAEAELAAGHPDAARAKYAEVLTAAPGRPEIIARYADFLVSQGETAEAYRQITLGLTARPGSPLLQEALMRQRYRTGGLRAALLAADELRRDSVNLPAAALLRGELLSADGEEAEAAIAYEAELSKAPSTALVMRAAAAELGAHGPAAALQLLRPWVKAHPADLSALAMLSTMLTRANQTEAAADALGTLLAQQPNDVRVMNNLAVAYHELGDARAFPLALRAYLSTFDPNVADTFGQILLASDRTQEAVTLLRFAGRELPENLPVQLHLAKAVLQAGLNEEARAILTGLVMREFDGRASADKMLADMGTR